MLKIIAVILLLSMIITGCLPVSASPIEEVSETEHHTIFDVVSVHRAAENITSLEGAISTVHAIADRKGAASVQQDIQIKLLTDEDIIIKISSSYDYGIDYANGTNILKISIYEREGEWGKDYDSVECVSKIGEIYHYKVVANERGIYAVIKHNGNIVLSYRLPWRAWYITSASFYIAYWRYNQPGSFYYYGYITISNSQDIEQHMPLYYKAVIPPMMPEPFNIYYIRHNKVDNWSCITNKGEIDDR